MLSAVCHSLIRCCCSKYRKAFLLNIELVIMLIVYCLLYTMTHEGVDREFSTLPGG